MAKDADLIEALRATEIFGGLDKRALKRVADAMTKVHHDAGKTLATQGQDGVAFHLILEGTVTVTVAGRPPHQLSQGEYFGEISMIDGEPRSATVTVDTALTTASLTAWSFRPLLDEEPTITKALVIALCKRIRASEAV
jgi:CRP/FNR family transcriptional regulator, cyclic AMP receptor protein